MEQFLIDTNVLLYDPNALFSFEENTVIIPMVVIEDIGRLKKDPSETGRNARQTSRILDELRQKGSLSDGVGLPNGGRLMVRLLSPPAMQQMPREYREDTRDTLMLATVLDVKKSSRGIRTVLVSKDLNLRIKADALGIDVMDFEAEKVDIGELYSGLAEIRVAGTVLDTFVEERRMSPPLPLHANQYLVVRDEANPERIEYGRFDIDTGQVNKLLSLNEEGVYRLQPRNEEQRVALDALLDDSIQLVTLVGKAGTGKTLLAVAASLFKTVEQNVYSRILVSRPTLPMGKDIGFLPGTVEEKLTPWMYPDRKSVV